jgi:hypothetical protein
VARAEGRSPVAHAEEWPPVARVAPRRYEGRAETWPPGASAEERPYEGRVETSPSVAERRVPEHTASAAVITAAYGTAPGVVSGEAGGGRMASALAGVQAQSVSSGFAGKSPGEPGPNGQALNLPAHAFARAGR